MYFDLKQNMSVRLFGRVLHKKGAWHNGRILSSHLMIFCIDGELQIQIDKTIYMINKGDVLIIPKSTFYKPISKCGCEYYFIHFEADTVEDNEANYDVDISSDSGNQNVLEGDSGYMNRYPELNKQIIKIEEFNKAVTEKISKLFLLAERLRPSKCISHKYLLDTYLREMIIMLSTDFSNDALNPKLKEVCNYINKNYAEQINLSLLSERFSINNSYLARLFQKELSLKPSEYITDVRLDNACQLLSFTDMSISQISEKVGFSDVYYFSRVFKKSKGITPSQFRNKNAFLPV